MFFWHNRGRLLVVGLCLELSLELSSYWASHSHCPRLGRQPFGRTQLCHAKDSGLTLERRAAACAGLDLSVRRSGRRGRTRTKANMLSPQSERLKRRIGRNVPASSAETRRGGCPDEKQSRRAEYNRRTASPCWVRMVDNIRCSMLTTFALCRNETRSLS